MITVVGLSGLLSREIARSAMSPLDELATAAGRVALGDFDVRTPVRSHDEIGRLAATFNAMTKALQTYVEALDRKETELHRDLARVGETLSGTHDLDRISTVALTTAMTNVDASAGAVLQLEGGPLGPARRRASAWRGELGVGLAGAGRLGGVPGAGRAPGAGRPGRDRRGFRPFHRRGRRAPTSLCAPIGVPERPFGVLCLYDPATGGGFTARDVQVIEAFATQASAAVENVLLHREAERLSITDGLTGLWNYRYLTHALGREIERADRFQRPLALLVLDLDHFKAVNDAHGHPRGDAVLVELAGRLRGADPGDRRAGPVRRRGVRAAAAGNRAGRRRAARGAHPGRGPGHSVRLDGAGPLGVPHADRVDRAGAVLSPGGRPCTRIGSAARRRRRAATGPNGAEAGTVPDRPPVGEQDPGRARRDHGRLQLGGSANEQSSPAVRAQQPVTKAVIPAAGLGTRFLPATKAIPKELLPVVDNPALEYIVEEAARAGLQDVLIITARGKTAIEDHFDAAPEIEAALEKKGDAERLARVRASSELAKVHFVRQGVAAGLGHAVLMGAEHVGNEPFVGHARRRHGRRAGSAAEQMIAEQEKHGGSVIALMEVPRGDGVAVRRRDRRAGRGDGPYGLVRVRDLVEKPPLEEAPSNLAIIGRYLLSPTVFEILRQTKPGRGGEIQLTDAFKDLAAEIEPVHGVVFNGRRYDTGDRADYIKAVVRLACERPTSVPNSAGSRSTSPRADRRPGPVKGEVTDEVGRPAPG